MDQLGQVAFVPRQILATQIRAPQAGPSADASVRQVLKEDMAAISRATQFRPIQTLETATFVQSGVELLIAKVKIQPANGVTFLLLVDFARCISVLEIFTQFL